MIEFLKQPATVSFSGSPQDKITLDVCQKPQCAYTFPAKESSHMLKSVYVSIGSCQTAF